MDPTDERKPIPERLALLLAGERWVTSGLSVLLNENAALMKVIANAFEIPHQDLLSVTREDPISWKKTTVYPDLVFKANDRRIATIEGKLGAKLTKAQPVGYLEELPENGSLIFVTPQLGAGGRRIAPGVGPAVAVKCRFSLQVGMSNVVPRLPPTSAELNVPGAHQRRRSPSIQIRYPPATMDAPPIQYARTEDGG